MAKVIVVYGGGFQPFHAGHLSSYLEAKRAFPKADFYVAASNDTKTRPIPFDDKQYLAQQAGVNDPFVQVKMPINPKEILDRYSPKQDIFILVRSERDPVGYTKKDGSPGYYQPFTSLDKCEPFGYHGYVFVTKKHVFKLNGQEIYSGTQVRDMYANSDDKGRMNIIKQLYPSSQQQDTIKQMLDKYIGSSEPIIEPGKSAIKQLKAKKLKEQIQRMRPLIKEASIEQKYKMLKLIKEATRLDELNLFGKKVVSKDKLPQKSEPVKAVDDYRSYFKTPEPSKPTGKVYHNPDEYYRQTKKDPFAVKEDDIDETRIIDPTSKVDVYYVNKNNQRQKCYKSIPYSLVDKAIRILTTKYRHVNPKDIEVRPTDYEYVREEGVNEISDTTLQSYLGKADRQISNRLGRMSQARERLNKNYEIYDVNNPTKIIDKFEANTPELAREYYNKFIKEYDPGDQDFHFEVRRSTGLGEQGVAEAVHPDVVSKEYFNDPTRNVRMGDFEFNARTFTGGLGQPNAKGLQIRAYDPKQPKGRNLIGSVDFIVKTDKKGNQWLESDDTEVDDEYQGKGIAAMMYAFAKSLGNDIKDSPYQSKAGSAMWSKWGSDAKNLMREDKEPKIADVVIDFYKPVVSDIHKEKIDNYIEQARELMHKAPNNTVREKLIDIFKTGKTNPYLQGGIITTVGALLAGGVLSSAQTLGLNPAQTNLALQAILNTVIPTIVSRVNGKNWIDTVKYTLASAGVGTAIAGAGLLEDISQDYLEEK